MRTVARVFTAGTPSNRLFRFALGVLAGAIILAVARNLVLSFPTGVDLEIPLRAAERWLHGGEPYVASSFQVESGPGLPYLYPPFLLPLLAPLTSAPRSLVLAAWCAVCGLSALATLRRLAVPWRYVPGFLLWPPFLEGILGGNVQILLFAAFVFAFWAQSSAQPAERPFARLAGSGFAPAWRAGLAASIGLLKITQVHAWLLALRANPRNALLAASVFAALVASTLPLTGFSIYLGWLHQLQRASDPAWIPGGPGIGRVLPSLLVAPVVLASALATFKVPRGTAATWTGVLLIVGSPSLHSFGWLFLLPALLTVRAEIALIAVLCLASYGVALYWLAFVLVVGCLALGHRWPAFLEHPRLVRSDRLRTTSRGGGLDTTAVHVASRR